MAALIGHSPSAIVGAPGEVHTTAKNPILTRSFDINGNEYIYLAGVDSTVSGDAVVYDEAGATIRTVAASIGPLAIATAATVASTWGWYQIFGKAIVNGATGLADNKSLTKTATDGVLDDATVGVEVFVFGAWSRSALDTPSTGKIYAQLNYPFCTAETLD